MAKKHVCIECPLALGAKSAKALHALARKQGESVKDQRVLAYLAL
jgi:predicted dehydrogenase